jgi:hypothetical protein
VAASRGIIKDQYDSRYVHPDDVFVVVVVVGAPVVEGTAEVIVPDALLLIGTAEDANRFPEATADGEILAVRSKPVIGTTSSKFSAFDDG